MKYQSLIPALSDKRCECLLIVFVLAALLCLSQSALAQSGRRQSKGVSPPPPPPPVTTEPKTEREAAPPVTKPAPAASLIVGGDRYGSSLYVLPGYVDEVVGACIEKLKKSPGLEVTGGGNMTRKDAIDLAKKQTDAHVLWLEIKVEEDGSDSASVGYSLFMPQTAKTLTSGRVYLGANRVGSGRVGVGVPSVTGRMPLEYQLREAGQGVADRIISKFHVGRPDSPYKD